MPSPFVVQQTSYLAHRLFKQGVLLAQPYLMLQAECFHEQGLEKCCSKECSHLRSAAFLPVTEGLACGQHLNHP